jgi:uncharacterized protein with FMN-binding domain
MRTPRRTTIAIVSGASAIAALAACSSSDAATTGTSVDGPADATTAAADDATTAATSNYADGSYSATGTYQSPAGKETIDVSVTLAGGVITAVEVTPDATNPTSKQYQTAFASGVSDVVVGKEIAGLTVDTVSGSSLTPDGFNAALAEIAADAQA